MSTMSKVQEILRDANQGEYVSLKCENDSTNINGYVVYLSKEKVDAIKLDDWTKGWPKEEPTVLGPLCFTAEEAGSTVKIPFANFKTSTDGTTWTPYTSNDTITLANVGDKVYFKANGSNDVIQSTFVMTGKIAASGNINSLLTDDDEAAMTIALTSNYCYDGIFQYCDSLTQAPELPATTLAKGCYQAMFWNCTSLTQAPELPAQTLAEDCYYSMFSGCISLAQAPELPASVLVDGCYYLMFNNCSSLSYINVGLIDWNLEYATCDWVSGVSSTGTFKCPATLPQIRGVDNIPSGWTIVTK